MHPGQQGCFSACDREQTAINARGRGESACWYPLPQLEGEPGRPLSGHQGRAADAGATTGYFPLDDQDRMGPSGCAQDVPQHRRRLVEGEVPHQDVSSARQPVVKEVSVNHLDPGVQLPFEGTGEPAIDLDRGQWSFQAGQTPGQGTCAGPDLDDWSGGGPDALNDCFLNGLVVQKVLAVLMTAVTVGGHWEAP